MLVMGQLFFLEYVLFRQGFAALPFLVFMCGTVQNEMNFRPFCPELNLRLKLWKI